MQLTQLLFSGAFSFFLVAAINGPTNPHLQHMRDFEDYSGGMKHHPYIDSAGKKCLEVSMAQHVLIYILRTSTSRQ